MTFLSGIASGLMTILNYLTDAERRIEPMNRASPVYRTYLEILKRELVCAMGCTEPIALAYCAATARAVLGRLPERILVEASGNIIKNVKSVVVPNTDSRRGIAAAACVGALAGDEKAGLQVLSRVTDEAREQLGSYMENTPVEIRPLASEHLLDMIVTVWGGSACARVRIANEHTNIVLIEKDGKALLTKDPNEKQDEEGLPDYTLLTVQGIYDFACTCDLDDVRDILDRQIACNIAIAEEGLRHDYGANIGKVLLKTSDDLRTRAQTSARCS